MTNLQWAKTCQDSTPAFLLWLMSFCTCKYVVRHVLRRRVVLTDSCTDFIRGCPRHLWRACVGFTLVEQGDQEQRRCGCREAHHLRPRPSISKGAFNIASHLCVRHQSQLDIFTTNFTTITAVSSFLPAFSHFFRILIRRPSPQKSCFLPSESYRFYELIVTVTTSALVNS